MPSPDKDRPSGRLGRLLSALRPSRAGPLPVQTGFPTSLADLVVKNHGRLKKQPSPSSRRRKGGVSASPPPSTSPSPPPSSPPPPPPTPAAAAVLPSDPPRPDLSPVPAVRRDKSGTFGLGLGFLAFGGVVSLALLVIWSKKVVAAVTVAAFSLFLLESLRCSSRLPRRPPTEGQLYWVGRGRVSPIREVEAEETEPSRASCCADSDRGLEVEASSSTLLSSAAEQKSGAVEESSNNPNKAKTKRRAWKKLIANAKKLHRGRKSNKEPAGDSRSCSFRSDVGDAATARSSSNVTAATDSSGSRRDTWTYEMDLDIIADANASDPDPLCSRPHRRGKIHLFRPTMGTDAPADLTGEEEEEEPQQQRQGSEKAGGVRFPALVLVAVALVGLVAGKLPAVAFTMLCAAFFSWVPGFRCRGDGSRLRRSESELPVL